MKKRTLSFALFFVSHSVSATAIAFVLAMIFGGLSPLIAFVSLAVSFLRATRFTKAMQNSLEWRATEAEKPWNSIDFALVIFIMFAGWKHFGWLLANIPGPIPSISTLSATNYGDLPLHINFIRALANGIDFMPMNPIFALEPLRYPFGPDLYNALWESIGVQTSGHLFVTGLCATFASIVLLRELGGAWAVAAFFLAGGSAAADTASSIDWKSFFLAIWITQRGMLFALPIGITLLLYLRGHLSGATRLPRKAVSGMGRMWAVFPLFHAHSFVVVSLLLFALTWRDFGIRRTKEFLKRFFIENRALAWAIIPATLLIRHTSADFSKASILHLRPFWLMPEGATFFEGVAWFGKNFGLPVSALLIIGWISVFAQKYWMGKEGKQTERSHLDEVLILLSFFTFFLFVMLAPWEWDNIKALLWPWLLLFAVLGRSIRRLSNLKLTFLWTLLTWVGIGCAFSPGIAVLAQSWNNPQEKSTTVWTVEQTINGEAVLARISKKAVFAAAPTPVHVLAYFGRLRALGYPGHLWSHAIEYRTAEAQLDRLMTGTEGWVEAAKSLKVSHIYWGPEERARWGSQEKSWQSKLPLVAKAGDHEVYEVKETR